MKPTLMYCSSYLMLLLHLSLVLSMLPLSTSVTPYVNLSLPQFKLVTTWVLNHLVIWLVTSSSWMSLIGLSLCCFFNSSSFVVLLCRDNIVISAQKCFLKKWPITQILQIYRAEKGTSNHEHSGAPPSPPFSSLRRSILASSWYQHVRRPPLQY